MVIQVYKGYNMMGPARTGGGGGGVEGFHEGKLDSALALEGEEVGEGEGEGEGER